DPAADARMRDLGVQRIPIAIDRAGLNPVADLRLLARYRSLLKRLRPAAYLGYTIKPNIYGSFAAATLGIPALPKVSGLGTLFIGRILRDKGVAEFVEAARSLRPEYPDARFQLLGPLDEGNRTAIRRPELNSWLAEGIVEHLGTTDDVRPFIAASTAVVLPSY